MERGAVTAVTVVSAGDGVTTEGSLPGSYDVLFLLGVNY